MLVFFSFNVDDESPTKCWMATVRNEIMYVCKSQYEIYLQLLLKVVDSL